MSIYGGNYIIPDSEYPQFLELYFRDVICAKKPEYLVEKQREDGSGPILVDVDFRHDYEVTEKQYTQEHIEDLVHAYLEEIKEMYQLDESTQFPVYVFEKTKVKRMEKEQKTKSGIHLVIGIKADATTQMILRDKIIKKASEMWEDMPITNDWTDVFDECISNGTNGWQLFGSQKPGYDKYELTSMYDVKYCSEDGEFEYPNVPAAEINIKEHLYKMSARYPSNITLFMKSEFAAKYNERKGSHPRNSMRTSATPSPPLSLSNHYSMGPMVDPSRIRNQSDLESAVNQFLDSMSAMDYEVREMHNIAMILPAQYYEMKYQGNSTYEKWIRVCWALKSTHPKLILTWLAFSARATGFDFSTIPYLCELWEKHDPRDPRKGGLTKLSLMYWARTDAKEAYEVLKMNTIQHFLNESIYNPFSGKPGQDGEYDIARVLYQLFKHEYVCVSIKADVWYQYKNHRWKMIECGTNLRKAISEELRDLYKNKHMEIMLTVVEPVDGVLPDGFDKNVNDSKKNGAAKCSNIITKLGRTNDKKNIMTEAKELFHDPEFMEKLDTNQYLLCFNNGVVDFKTKEFRKGLPEDYISMTTKINYFPVLPQHKSVVDEINQFMQELFPEPELCQYMWDHLASTLIGTSPSQTFNMYIGEGSNGKSVLVSLMELVLGEYKGVLPLSAVIDQRGRVGGVTPELVQLKGKRLAVMQEPRKGDVMNEGTMKELTSGKDPITCRAPYMTKMLTFIPQFKLIVTCNTLMGVKANDHGTWRRIRAVPFLSLFTNEPVQDDATRPYQFKLVPDIDEKFDNWKEVLAAMLVARGFISEGIVKDCDIVMAKSSSYRESQNVIAGFVKDKLVASPTGKLRKQELRTEFGAWFQENHGGREPNIKELHEYIDKVYRRVNNQWVGVEIKCYEHDAEQEEIGDYQDGIDLSRLG